MTDDNWWMGPWECRECDCRFHGYDLAEHHAHYYNHTVDNTRNP